MAIFVGTLIERTIIMMMLVKLIKPKPTSALNMLEKFKEKIGPHYEARS